MNRVSPEAQKLLAVLKTTMRVLGYSSRDVERRLGLSASYLSRLFSGKIDLKVDQIAEIARAMELDPAEIFQIAFPLSAAPTSQAAERLREAMNAFAAKSTASTPTQEAPPGPRGTSTPTPEDLESLMAKTLMRLFRNLPPE